MSHPFGYGPSGYGDRPPLAVTPVTIKDAATADCEIVLDCDRCRCMTVCSPREWVRMRVAEQDMRQVAWVHECGHPPSMVRLQRRAAASGMARTIDEWIPANAETPPGR